MGGCLGIASISFPRERVYWAIAQKRPFVYSIIAYQRLYLFVSRYFPSSGCIRHNIIIEMLIMEEVHNICPIHKKGDLMECRKYIGISLVNSAYKVLSDILFKRISPYAENLSEVKREFPKDRTNIKQILFHCDKRWKKLSRLEWHCTICLWTLSTDTQDTINSYTRYNKRNCPSASVCGLSLQLLTTQ
jgi:hypothetical protein